MKERSETEVYNDLIKAGVPKEQARKLSKGAILEGNKAKNYVKVNYPFFIVINLIYQLLSDIFISLNINSYEVRALVN